MKNLCKMLILFSFITAIADTALAQTGQLAADLDYNFGYNQSGIVNTGLSGFGSHIAVQSNDEIIVNNQRSISRFDPDGNLISSVPCPFGTCNAMVRLPNDHLLVVGSSYQYQPVLGLAELDSNLAINTSFGTGGLSIRSWGFTYYQPQQIVLARSSFFVIGNGYNDVTPPRQFVAEFLYNGSGNSTFAGGVVFESDPTMFAKTAAVYADSIFIGGTSTVGTENYATIVAYRFGGKGAGTRNLTFNNGQPFRSQGGPAYIAINSSGGVYFSAGCKIGSVSLTGKLVTTFGQNGFIDLQGSCTDRFAVDPTGRIVFSGYLFAGTSHQMIGRIALSKRTTGLDSWFSNSAGNSFNHGLRIFYPSMNPNNGRFIDFAFQSFGRIVALSNENYGGGTYGNRIYRFNGEPLF